MFKKNLNRRDFLKAAAISATAVALGACATAPTPGTANGATKAPEATKAPAPEAAKGKIVWYMNIDESRNKWANDVIVPAFKEKNPNIEIELMTVPWDQFDPKILSLTAAGTPPDVFAQWGQSGGGTYVKKGVIRPIDDLVSAAKWDLTNISESTKNAYKFNGKLYGIPMYVLGTYIYYNKDLFDKAGIAYPPVDWDDKSWTWDELVSRAQKLTHDVDSPDKAVFGFANGINDLYVGIPWLFGAEPFGKGDYDKGEVGDIKLDSEEFIAAAQAKADLINKLKVSPSQSTMDALGQNGNPLAAGRIAMIYGGGWVSWELAPLKDLKWGLAAAPRGKSRKVPTFSDPWYIAAGSKNPNAAFKLVEYLTVGPGQDSIAKVLAAPPADTSKLPMWYDSIPQMKPNELETAHKGMLKNSHETPASLLFGYGAVEDIYNQLMGAVWQGEKTAAEVLPEVQKQAIDAISKLSK